MARSAPHKRLNLSPAGDEGGPWTVVGKRRRKASPPSYPPQFRQYRLLSHQESSDFHAVRRLEAEHPDLSIRVLGSSRSSLLLRPQDNETAFLLARVAREGEPFGISLEEVEVETRGVVLRYPVGFSLDPILGDPRVAFARRCTYSAGHGRRYPTRQVEVTFRGQLPNSLDLGSWGVFSVRRYTPEPLRCFKCQAYGHVQKHCRTRDICGVCSGRHPTSECISALRAGESRPARCPNCGKGHHAWSKFCPERLRRLPPSSKGRDSRVALKENDTKPLPAAPLEVSRCALGKRSASHTQTDTATATTTEPSKRRRRRRRRKRPCAMDEPATAPPVPTTTTDAACQTELPPPPPETTHVAVQAAPETCLAAVQAAPALCDANFDTNDVFDDCGIRHCVHEALEQRDRQCIQMHSELCDLYSRRRDVRQGPSDPELFEDYERSLCACNTRRTPTPPMPRHKKNRRSRP